MIDGRKLEFDFKHPIDSMEHIIEDTIEYVEEEIEGPAALEPEKPAPKEKE